MSLLFSHVNRQVDPSFGMVPFISCVFYANFVYAHCYVDFIMCFELAFLWFLQVSKSFV
jgi:hypothetical protein